MWLIWSNLVQPEVARLTSDGKTGEQKENTKPVQNPPPAKRAARKPRPSASRPRLQPAVAGEAAA